MCDKMEACEENLQKLESQEWETFVEMGIIGEGEGKNTQVKDLS